MKRYYGYVRVSDPKQGRGASLPEQRAAIEAYAKRHELRLVGWFEEVETAARLGRAQFNRMLDALTTGQAEGVIIHKIDRGVRHLKDWAHLGELTERGMELHFAHENLDLNTRSGRLTADILAVMAADYIRNLREEVRKGIYGRLRQGVWPWPAPLGYLDAGAGRPKIQDPERAQLILTAFELYGTGRYSYDLLVPEMTRRGLTTRAGRPLSRFGLTYVLQNPFYFGLMRVARTAETFEGGHEPIITKALFDRCQAVAAGRYYAPVFTHEHVYRRLIRCGACGRALTGEVQKGRVYYRCHSPLRCGTSLREDRVDSQLDPLFRYALLQDEELEDLRDVRDEANAAFAARSAEGRMRLVRSVAHCEARLATLTDAFLDKDIDKETYHLRKERLLAELLALREAERQLQAGRTEDWCKTFELAKVTTLRFHLASPDERREIVSEMSSNLYGYQNQLGVRLRRPFSDVAKLRISQECGPRLSPVRTRALSDAQRGVAFKGDVLIWQEEHGLPVQTKRLTRKKLQRLVLGQVPNIPEVPNAPPLEAA